MCFAGEPLPWPKNNPYMHNKAQALLLQRQSPDKGMPHKNPYALSYPDPLPETQEKTSRQMHTNQCSLGPWILCPFGHCSQQLK